MKNQTLNVLFKIKPFSEKNNYKYLIHILVIFGVSLFFCVYSFIFLSKYEKDSSDIIEKRFNLARRVKDFFAKKRDEGYTPAILKSIKILLKMQEERGKFVDLERDEDEIFEEISEYIDNNLERLEEEIMEEKEYAKKKRSLYMSNQIFQKIFKKFN